MASDGGGALGFLSDPLLENDKTNVCPCGAERLEGGLASLELLGLVLGKALYEGILVDMPLAPFFVSRLQVNVLFNSVPLHSITWRGNCVFVCVLRVEQTPGCGTCICCRPS